MRDTPLCFDGELVYANTHKKIEAACEELLAVAQALQRAQKQLILGFDMEWSVSAFCGCSSAV